MGDYQGALAAYDQALALEPGMEDALHNRALVERMKEQQQQEQHGDQGESGESESSEDEQEGASSEQPDGQEGEEGEESEEQESEGESQSGEGQGEEQGEPQLDYAEAWSEEDAQAMEQWLRRIPDDPGGLLRRKFRNQHQRRGAPEDETDSW